ncbi:MAG: glycoside hydrolase family 28 protein [Bacteroidota bacterium]
MLTVSSCTVSSQENPPKLVEFSKDIEFAMPAIREPEIPGYTVSIVDFGAISGGQELNTKAFAEAIAAVSSKGGGKVIIPPGIWLTGPIILKSNLELHAEEGSMIIFSTDKNLYPLVETSFEGLNTWRCISPIYGVNVENVAFTGKGVWDGSGDAWRFVKKDKLTSSQWKKLVASGGVTNAKGNAWYPSEQYMKASEGADMNIPLNLKTKEEYEAIRDFLRPVMVSIQNSRRIMFDGPVFQNSPAWCIHPLIVEDLILRNLTIRNPWYSQNGDGMDIESCKNVLVDRCNLDVGDDAICIKSGKDEEGRKRGIPTENIVITNCIVYHGHGGVTVGSEMSGGVRNMHVSGCTFMGTDVGLRFKSNRGRGGVVENIYISDIRMTDIPTYAISFNLYYGGQSVSELLEDGNERITSEPEPVTEATPLFRSIFIRDIEVKGAYQSVILQGLPEMNLENVKLSSMLLQSEYGISIADASGVEINDIHLITSKGKAVDIYNSKDVSIRNLDYAYSSGTDIMVRGEECSAITIGGAKDMKNFVTLGTEVKKNEVKF